jgi:internalin A
MHHELLQLMIKFKLCYKIQENNEKYIAPQLLSENQPKYEWEETSNIILRYSYEFMPKGIITRLIVAMHPLIANQQLVWKNGIVIEKDYTRAEVIEYYAKREISIRISGKNKKELMAIVNYHLDAIHNSYQSLKFIRLIPCNCEVCREIKEPFFYKYETLRKYARDNQSNIECQVSYKKVNVLALIDDTVGKDNFKLDTLTAKQDGNIFFGPIDKVVIQQIVNSSLPTQQINNGVEPMANESHKPPTKSAWHNGLFYLLVFVVVIGLVWWVANSVSFYVFPIVVIAGVLFLPIISAFQLRQDEQLSEKSFLSLLKTIIKQLPLLRYFTQAQKNPVTNDNDRKAVD